MCNTTLTGVYNAGHRSFGWDAEIVQMMVLNADKVALLPEIGQAKMIRIFRAAFDELAKA